MTQKFLWLSKQLIHNAHTPALYVKYDICRVFMTARYSLLSLGKNIIQKARQCHSDIVLLHIRWNACVYCAIKVCKKVKSEYIINLTIEYFPEARKVYMWRNYSISRLGLSYEFSSYEYKCFGDFTCLQSWYLACFTETDIYFSHVKNIIIIEKKISPHNKLSLEQIILPFQKVIFLSPNSILIAHFEKNLIV